jgi:crotonyl-CoA carboxylase/reductase
MISRPHEAAPSGLPGTNDEQAGAYNDLVRSGAIDPCLGRVMTFDEIPAAHEPMANGIDVFGNLVALIGATAPGPGRTD